MGALINMTAGSAGRLATLDELWKEAESLGCLDIRTEENFRDSSPKGYRVSLYFQVRRNRVTVDRENPSLQCAISDCITEARVMGAGELP